MRRFIFGLFLAGALATTGCDQTVVSPAAALVSGQHGITAIVADGAYVYWSTGDGAIKRVSIDGGEPATVVAAQPYFAGPTNGPATLQVDANRVYWTTSAAVMAAEKVGGAPIMLAGMETPLSDLTGLSVNDETDFVYFTHRAGYVRKAPKTPGDMITLASDELAASSPVVRGANLYWATETDSGGGAARVVDISGGSSGTVATVDGSESAASFAGVSVDDSNVYWTSGGAVSWVSIAGGTANVIQSGDFLLSAVLGDDTNVYWASPSGDVSTAPVTPDVSPASVASGSAGRVSLAVDTTSLYWANETDGTVVAMPKLAVTGEP